MHMRFGFGLSLTLLLMLMTMSEMLQQVHGRQKLCGEALNRALDLICVNGFSRRIKRDLKQTANGAPNHSGSSTHHQDQAILRKWLAFLHKTELDERQRLVSVESDRTFGGTNLRRHRRRIAHECCREGCTYEDIMEYCA
ncbi:probable insulin-like peptide 4 [Drosophila tropicalis]|uniref:probable insulin-like peptide 4 n=1 Tax=Drosophila tropicalis TaxID=46794 RepID=UPI0035AB6A95